jgi:hypothetical protein
MPPRKIVIYEGPGYNNYTEGNLNPGVFDQINRGNAELATFIYILRRTESEIWMTEQDYNRLSRSPANARLLMELQVRVSGLGHPTNERVSRLVQIPHDAHQAASLALRLGAELVTMDKRALKNFLSTGGKSAVEMAEMPTVTTATNYNAGRTNLGLRPLNISNADGRIYPPNNPAPQYRPELVRQVHKAPPATQATLGVPISAPKEYGPSAVGNAKFQLARLLLGLADYAIQWINDEVQKKRFEERWAKLRPGVEATLDADPQNGVLIMIYYYRRKKVGAENESPLQHTTVFKDIAVAYGQTREDARIRYALRPTIIEAGPGEMIVDDSVFHPPKNPVDVTKLWTPFPKAGLATFIPGKEKLARVKFSGSLGFDEKHFSVARLDVPAGVTPRFLYLWPPSEITYMNGGRQKSVDVKWKYSDEAERTHADIGPMFYGVPIVELDSWINPGDFTAAMVYPADNVTARVFKTGRTVDNLDQLKAYGLDLMRWVRPQNMRILRHFY